MKIFLGTDHAGFELKEKLKIFLKAEGHQVADEGAFEFDPADDYPEFVKIVAQQVACDPENNRGIILGASGQGEAICANRYIGIRAAVYYGGPEKIVTLSREHNNANILALGANFLSPEQAEAAVKLWLTTKFSHDERHLRRLGQIDYRPPEQNNF